MKDRAPLGSLVLTSFNLVTKLWLKVMKKNKMSHLGQAWINITLNTPLHNDFEKKSYLKIL